MAAQGADAPPPAILQPKLISFDVFGTLISVRDGSYAAFASILRDAGGSGRVDVKEFWEHWEERNIAHYWEPYRRYRDICELSLAETLAHYGLNGAPALIRRYFDAFPAFRLYEDVLPTLDKLASRYRLAIVSNIDDDLLHLTPLARDFDLVCTAERAGGYKPDGTLFKFLIEHAQGQFSAARRDILHCGQSQFTDMVGAKPLGLTVAWINRRGVALSPDVPPPDYTFSDIASALAIVADDPPTILRGSKVNSKVKPDT
ncbi:MAG: HAD hydrolase-like protein [Hyphomonadaceae bacterium]|jgi:2-haloacid dehalogenase|nr:HAD hydrolase-like protein [Hyphomonadaceae bacterium]